MRGLSHFFCEITACRGLQVTRSWTRGLTNERPCAYMGGLPFDPSWSRRTWRTIRRATCYPFVILKLNLAQISMNCLSLGTGPFSDDSGQLPAVKLRTWRSFTHYSSVLWLSFWNGVWDNVPTGPMQSLHRPLLSTLSVGDVIYFVGTSIEPCITRLFLDDTDISHGLISIDRIYAM